ncbi:MAG: hypothetical protein QOF61_1161 [Acidobacteriota bacterium]|nr:hypothetical protein [Acidobacteriota bacterium]
MTHKLFNLLCAAFILLCAIGAARADIRIKQRMTAGSAGGGGGAGRAIETDVAIKGQRQRSESELVPGMKMINITQCDLKRTLAISDAMRKYTITPIGGVEEVQTGAANNTATAPAPAGRVTRGGVVTFVQTLTDTGERKQMFGYTARHIIMKAHSEHSPDACEKDDMAYETDGWYIDLEFNFECLTSNQRPNANPMARPSGCQDQMRFRRVGTAKLGYPVLVITRFFDKNGGVQTEMTQEVVSLSRETLDPALFDIPAGYTQASSQQELYDPSAMMKAMQQAQGGGGNEGGEGNRPQTGGMSAVSGGMNSSGATGAKQPGAIRIGVVRVGNKTTQSIDAGNLRSVLIASIMEGSVEAIPLNETAPDAAQAEAKQKNCDYVLFTDISTLKQSTANKIGGMLGRATGAANAADRFEAKLDYTLVPVAGGAPVQANASAKEDGGAGVSVNSALKKEAQAVVSKVRK